MLSNYWKSKVCFIQSYENSRGSSNNLAGPQASAVHGLVTINLNADWCSQGSKRCITLWRLSQIQSDATTDGQSAFVSSLSYIILPIQFWRLIPYSLWAPSLKRHGKALRTAVCLDATDFKPVIFSVLECSLSNVANILFYIIRFLLIFFYLLNYIYERNFESHMTMADLCIHEL